jgi:uncharacterized protein (DUF1778 family)
VTKAGEKVKRVEIRLSEREYERLLRACVLDESSVSQFVRGATKRYAETVLRRHV